VTSSLLTRRTWARALAVALAAATALVACATTTTTATWRDPALGDVRFRSLLVMGVGEDQFARRKYEDALASALRDRGVRATTSYSMLPDSRRLSEEEVDDAVRSRGFEGVIVTRVTATGEETVHYPGYYQYYRLPLYDHYYRFYAYSYDRVWRPGYTDVVQTVSLETLLYQAPGGRVAWGMRSKSIEPENLDRLVRSLVEETVRNLAESGLL
jgi:hypothetical protein